jgi:Ca2+-dependent lipid-binding protein
MDLIGSSDPYVVLELLPFSLYHKPEKECKKTTIQKRTLNPEFNELFLW